MHRPPVSIAVQIAGHGAVLWGDHEVPPEDRLFWASRSGDILALNVCIVTQVFMQVKLGCVNTIILRVAAITGTISLSA